MPIITFTTDFGWRDHYLATIKGAILCECPQAVLVDITHGISNYNIVQAAFLFRSAWQSFPPGTIHLVSVNDYYAPHKRFLAAEHQGHYFVAPDNGLLSLIFAGAPVQAVELAYDAAAPFPLKEVYAQPIARLAQGQALAELGPAAEEVAQRIALQPVIGSMHIRGSIVYIDNYENAISNISRELFEQVAGQRRFALFFKRHDPLRQLVQDYHDVPVGEPLCRFNSLGYLELAVNLGKAASLLGLKVDDSIQIDFHS